MSFAGFLHVQEPVSKKLSILLGALVVKSASISILFTKQLRETVYHGSGHLYLLVFIQGYWRDANSEATGLSNMITSKTEMGPTSLLAMEKTNMPGLSILSVPN